MAFQSDEKWRRSLERSYERLKEMQEQIRWFMSHRRRLTQSEIEQDLRERYGKDSDGDEEQE